MNRSLESILRRRKAKEVQAASGWHLN